jgi:LacI family transcriptional regulator
LVTIKDIAKEAKVSAGTVDRVLHNRGGVSLKTEAKIKKILKEKNFKINLIASSLAMKKHYKLATLMPQYDDDNIFWKSPFSGLQKASQEVNAYGIETINFTFDLFDPKSYMEAFKELIQTEPDGVVMIPVFNRETASIIDVLKQKNIPYLFFNVNLKGFDNLCFIGQKSFEGGLLSGQLLDLCSQPGDELLVVLTRKNIFNYEANHQRLRGFFNYFEKNKRVVKIHQLQFDNLSRPDEVRKKINEYLKTFPKIRGIMVPSSRVSNIAELIEEKQLNGLKVIGFDTTPRNVSALKKGGITFLISQKSFNQGYKSIITMSNYLVHREIPPAEIPTPLEIITKENIDFSQYDRKNYSNDV